MTFNKMAAYFFTGSSGNGQLLSVLKSCSQAMRGHQVVGKGLQETMG